MQSYTIHTFDTNKELEAQRKAHPRRTNQLLLVYTLTPYN